jgi:V/A-type H+/Na+-transporting ATPase subunit C
MSRLSEDPNYGFAIGRVRALEPALMDRARYERFKRARNGEEFAAALAETAYGRFLENGVAGVTQALDSAAGENAGFLSEYALDDWLLQLFSIPSAIRELKMAVKSALSQGRTDVGFPKELEGGSYKPLADRVVAQAMDAFTRGRNPAAVDVALDRLMQQIELQVSSSSEFVTGYLGLHADIENLRTLVRLRTKEDADENLAGEMGEAYIPGGTLTLAVLSAALPLPWPAVLDLLAKSPPYGSGSEAFHDYLEQGRAALVDRRSFARMERLGREAELRYVRQTRYATFGHEPLVAFFLLRENELRNLRLLFAAKLAGLPDEETQDLVAYVE